MISVFRDRTDAGRRLAQKLRSYRGRPDVVVLALPRGGVPVAAEVAAELDAPLDVFLVRKLGVPGHDELAMGAIATGGTRVLNESVIRHFGIPRAVVDHVAEREGRELERRERRYRGTRPFPTLAGKTVILVDDGIATGASVRAAVRAICQQEPARIVVAVPVAPLGTVAAFAGEVHEIVCVEKAEAFDAVDFFYETFAQTTDAEVCEILERPRSLVAAGDVA
jgi:putative phosphoribosyl transferase